MFLPSWAMPLVGFHRLDGEPGRAYANEANWDIRGKYGLTWTKPQGKVIISFEYGRVALEERRAVHFNPGLFHRHDLK